MGIVRFLFESTLLVRIFANGTLLCEFSAEIQFEDEVVLCLPAPLDETNILCRITSIECSSNAHDLFGGMVELEVIICKEIQVEADVKLEVLAKHCKPRPNDLPIPGPTPSVFCPPISFPPQCPGIFPPTRPCQPMINMTISSTSFPCDFILNGTVTCAGEPVAFGFVALTAVLAGMGSVSVPASVPIVNGLFTTSFSAVPPTIGMATVTASTTVNGVSISAMATVMINCPLPPCQPTITMTISATGNPCEFLIDGMVSCSGEPVMAGFVDLTAMLAGMGSVSVPPTVPIINGLFSASLTATPPTSGTATVTASTTINGLMVSTMAAINVNCPPLLPTHILTPGGEVNGGIATSNVDDYFCATDTWVTRNPMLQTRETQAGALLPNGIVIVSHGFVNAPFNATDTAEFYDPTTTLWSAAPSAAVARGDVGGDTLNGLYYVVGGTNDGTTPLNTVEIFDPIANTWSIGNPLPTPRFQLVAITLNGLLHTIGGFNGVELTTHEAYDPLTNTWSTKAPLPQPLAFLSAAIFGGKIYVIGGRAPGFTPTNVVYIYDPVTDMWTSGAAMPTPRWGMASCVCDSEIFVMGGFNPPNYLNIVEAYNPVTDTWRTNVAPMPTARAIYPCISL